MQYFLKRVQEFYIEACTQIKKCFDPVMKMLQVLDPDVKHSEFLSLVALAKRFSNFYQIQKSNCLMMSDIDWQLFHCHSNKKTWNQSNFGKG